MGPWLLIDQTLMGPVELTYAQPDVYLLRLENPEERFSTHMDCVFALNQLCVTYSF